jgi:hypothetical protein
MTDDHWHRFAVYSATGAHVGVLDDGLTAAKVMEEHPGGRIDELVTLSRALAMVAAAYEDAADEVTNWHSCDGGCVRDRTPADAQAALDALLRAERKNALDDALDKAPSYEEAFHGILSLIEKDKTNETT